MGVRSEATRRGYPDGEVLLTVGTGGGVASAVGEQGGGLGGGPAREPRRSPRTLEEAARRRPPPPVREETPGKVVVCTPLLSLQMCLFGRTCSLG